MKLTELEAIALEATPGPWKAIGGKCLAGVVAPNCQIYLHDARPDMFNSLPRWQATSDHIAAFDPPTALKLLALWRAAQEHVRLNGLPLRSPVGEGEMARIRHATYAREKEAAWNALNEALSALTGDKQP